MAGSINKVTLMGHLGRDPEVRKFQNGGQVVNLRVATSESWKDRNSGERKERTEWHSVAIFAEPLGRVAEQYLKKGSKVYLEGQLETRKWQDQNGVDKYSTEVVLRPYKSELVLLDRRGDGEQRSGDQGGGYRQESQPNQAPRGGGGGDRAAAPQRGAPYGGESTPYGNRSNGGYSGGYSSGGSAPYDDDIPF